MITEVEYRREMNRNYMIISSEEYLNDSYVIRMLSGNRVSGLLGFHEKYLNGQLLFYYDVTSKQPLHRLVEHRKLTARDIRTLVTDLVLVLREMERYLLDEKQICLKPEYIYLEPETYHGNFCLIPGMESEFSEEFVEFAQYILDHVDHSDGEAVVLAFSVFREGRKENFGVEDIERCLTGMDMRASVKTDMGINPETNLKTDIEMEAGWFQDSDLSDELMSESGKLIKTKQELCAVKKIVPFVLVGLMVGVPIGIFVFYGAYGVVRWKWRVAAIEMLLVAGLMGVFRKGQDFSKSDYVLKERTDSEEGVWEWEEEIECNLDSKHLKDDDNQNLSEDEDMQTVLLTSGTMIQTKKRLISHSDGSQITIEYFPFLIGKNRGLTDFWLNEPGVSRLHAKLERVGTEYFVTDLNSTNGTKLNGEILEANETRKIREGDELEFAGIRFGFQ